LGQALDTLAAGGPVVAVLLALSVVALAIVLAKAVQFAGPALAGEGRARQAARLLREGRVCAARDCVEGRRGLAPRVARDAIAGLAGGRPPELVREDALRGAAEALEGLRGWLRPLEVIAALAPLLGLFGTVLGMIDAFAALEAAGSRVDPATLSGGIWEALLTTAVGLAVAIPAVAAFNWFERRVERAELAIEGVVSAIVTADQARPLDRVRADDAAASRLAHAAE
jgi:biopolymer transport protein ExbB